MPAASWILIDPSSGDVLATQNAKTSYPIASATKLMTYYVARDKLPLGRDVVVAPYKAEPGESLAGLEPGDSLSAREAFYALLVPSGNDAAETISLATAGSEADFVSRMNSAADDLGLTETDFSDPIGISSANVSSARDLVDLTVGLRDDPLFRRIVDTPQITLRSTIEPTSIENRNTLLLSEPFVDGVKTGTTLEAGYVLVGSGERKGVELVSAVLGSPAAASRDGATLDLLEYGFSLYKKRTLVKEGEEVGAVAVAGSTIPLDLEAATGVAEVARADQRVTFDLDEIEPISDTVERGEIVGTVVVNLDGRKVGVVEAVANRAVLGPEESEDGATGMPIWAWLVFAGATLISAILAGIAIAIHRRG